jgi:glycolate oxidase FAD binding subunit
MTMAARLLVAPWPVTSCDLLTPSLAQRTGAGERPGHALAVRALAGQATADDLMQRVASLAASEGLAETCRMSGSRSAAFWKGMTETEVLADDALTARVVTAPGFLGGVLGEAEQAVPEGCGLEFHAHATSGVARLFVRSETGVVGAWIGVLRARAEAAGGHVLVERMPEPLVGRLDAWGAGTPSAALARRVKRSFDPKEVLSPGRFADGL